MHRIMSTSSLPKLLTMTARVYMRRPKATSARTWKVMPNPRMRGTLLSAALDGSKTKVLLVADMLTSGCRLSRVRLRGRRATGRGGDEPERKGSGESDDQWKTRR